MSVPDYTHDTPTFTGMPLDRAMDERTDPEMIARLLGDPRAGVLAASEQGVLVGDGDRPALLRLPTAHQVGERAAQTDDQPMLLGLDDGAPLFALDLDELPESERAGLVDGGRVVSLREAGEILSRSQAGLAAYLAAVGAAPPRARTMPPASPSPPPPPPPSPPSPVRTTVPRPVRSVWNWWLVPAGIVVATLFLMFGLFLHENQAPRRHRIDYLGSALMMFGAGALMLALVEVGNSGDDSVARGGRRGCIAGAGSR